MELEASATTLTCLLNEEVLSIVKIGALSIPVTVSDKVGLDVKKTFVSDESVFPVESVTSMTLLAKHKGMLVFQEMKLVRLKD